MGGPTTKSDRVKKIQLDTGATAEEAAAIDAQVEAARAANPTQGARGQGQAAIDASAKASQDRSGRYAVDRDANLNGAPDVKTANLRYQPGSPAQRSTPAAPKLPDANALLTDMKIKAGRAAPDATDIALKARQEAQAMLLTGASKRGRKSTFLTGPLGG